MADSSNDSGGLFGMGTSAGGLMSLNDPQLLFNLGAGVMSAAKYGGNLGDGLQQAVRGYQQQKLATQQYQQQALQQRIMQAQLPLIQSIGQQMPGLMGGGQPQPAMGAPQQSPQGGMTPVSAQQAPQQQPQQPQQPQGGNPYGLMQAGAMMDLAGMKGEGLTELGKTQIANNPQMATQMEAAKSAVAVDQQQIQQALAQGNRPLAQALYNGKLQQDLGLLHISSMGGIQTRVDPNSGVISTLNPSTGIESQGNQASLMPGMTGALQQKAQAEAAGQAAYEPMEVSDAQGNKYMVPRSVLGSRSSAPAQSASAPQKGVAPGAAPSASAPGNMAALGPSTSEMLVGNAKNALEANKDYQTQAEAGQQMLVQTRELRNAAADFTPGQFADSRMKFLQYLNSAGLISPEQANSLGSAQAGQKIAIQLQAAATKQLGSREAAQIFQIMGKSLPNLTLSQDGLQKVSGYMDGIARYNMARSQMAQQKAAANDANGVNNVRTEFINNSNPLYYIVASSPPNIQREIIGSMGKQAPQFLQQWNSAAKNGWAPRPNQYNGGS